MWWPFRKAVYEVYTDGGYKGRWGSWAFVIRKNKKTLFEKSGRTRKTDSTRMEIQAAVEALATLPADASVDLFSDSRILIDAMDKGLITESFASEISKLQTLAQDKKVRWHWVKAHAGNEFNERCDFLCVRARGDQPACEV
jgi:ribonuclease HI